MGRAREGRFHGRDSECLLTTLMKDYAVCNFFRHYRPVLVLECGISCSLLGLIYGGEEAIQGSLSLDIQPHGATVVVER